MTTPMWLIAIAASLVLCAFLITEDLHKLTEDGKKPDPKAVALKKKWNYVFGILYVLLLILASVRDLLT